MSYIVRKSSQRMQRNKEHIKLIYKFYLFPTDIVHLNNLSILLDIKANGWVLHSVESIVSFYIWEQQKMILVMRLSLNTDYFTEVV